MLGRSPLIGRAGELERAATALDRAAAGEGGALFLVGEAGIGKTRLVEESMRLASRRGFRALAGRIGPLEQGLSYALILDVLGPFLRSLGAAQRTALVAGLPHLGQLFGDLNLPLPTPLGDPRLEKTQLFEAVARLLERVATQTPLALFLDDLHWADTSSLELVHRLARVVEGRPVLLFGTMRPRESEERREVRTLISAVWRGPAWMEELVLSPLSEANAAAMVRGLLGGDVSTDLQRLLAARSGGWPLFVEALVRSAVETGKLARSDGVWYLRTGAVLPLPANLWETVRDRLDRGSDADRQVLDLVAVAGRDATHEVLTDVSGLDERELLRALQRLEKTGLLVEGSRGAVVAYTFAHPLFQEVVYERLPLVSRRRVHAAVAAAIERWTNGDVVALAHHYGQAGAEIAPARALEVLQAAGEKEWALHAYEAAARHWQAALDQARRAGREELLPEILERLGEAWALIGEGAAAVVIWTEALDLTSEAGDAVLAARLCRRLAMMEWDLGQFEAAGGHVTAGLEFLREAAPSLEHAELQHARTLFCRRLGDVEGASEAAGALAVLASQLRSDRCEAMAQLARSGVALAGGEFGAAVTQAANGLAAARRAGDMILTIRARDVLGLLAFATGSHGLVRELSTEGVAEAQAMGVPLLEVQPRLHALLADFLVGRWEEALAQSAHVIVLARRHSAPRILAVSLGVRSLLLAYRGELAEAEASAAEAEACYHADAVAGGHEHALVMLTQAVVALEKDDPVRAANTVSTFLSYPTSCGSPFCLSVLVEAMARRGDGGPVDDALRRLWRYGASGNDYAKALALRAAAQSREANGAPIEAMALLEQAIVGFEGVGLPFEVARAQCEWAALAVRDEPDKARDRALGSLRVFMALGAKRHSENARRLLSDMGIRFQTPRLTRQGALSQRELEVARLVSDGLTNAQVAARLHLSPRTVENHLQRMYERLRVPSRAALGRYLAERGLVDPLEENH